MSSRFRSLALVAACVICASAASTAAANDLLDAYWQAVATNPTLEAALHQRDASVEVRPQALSAFLPQLTASGQFLRQKDSIGGGSTGVAAAGTTPTIVNDPSIYYGNERVLALTLNEQIWSVEAFRRLQSANAQVAQAESSYRSQQQALILNLAKAYFNVLSAVDTLRTDRLARDAFGESLTQVQNRAKTGISAQTDVKQAQSYYDDTAQAVIDAQTTLDDDVQALANITGVVPTSIAPLVDDIPLRAPDPADAESWTAAALAENFDLRALDQGLESARRLVSADKAKIFPTVGIQGSLNRYDYSDNIDPDQQINTIGFVVNWPLGQGGLVLSQVRQQKATVLQLQAQLEGSRRDVARQSRAAFRNVVAGIARIKATRRDAESNDATLKAFRVGRDIGTQSEFEVLFAQNAYYNALRGYYQTRYDYLTALLTLKQLAGRLTESDLAAIDALLVVGGSRVPTSSATDSAATTSTGSP